MKYLKLFEDYLSTQDIISNLKDICLELNDDYIETACEYFPKKISHGNISGDFISVGIEKMDISDYNDVLSWGDISETIDRIIEYLKSENWRISSLNIDGENLINPEKWIENFRVKEHYSFWGLTMHFIKI